MARRERTINLDDPIEDRGTTIGDGGNVDSGGGDGGDSGSAGGSDIGGLGDGGSRSSSDSNRGTIFGDEGGDDKYIRGDDGEILYDVRGRPRKRRAKRGSGKQKAQGKKLPVDALATFLALAHGTLAAVTKTPELELTENEAKMLANPLAEILVLYDVAPSREILLAMQMAHAGSYVYGPRFFVWRERMKAEAEERRAKAAKNITPPSPVEQAREAFAGMEVISTEGLNIQTNYDAFKK